MTGEYIVKVYNRRVQYKFLIRRNITVLRGDSASGKTTLIEMIQQYQNNGMSSAVTVECSVPCVALAANNWQLNLSMINNSIVFIDEGDKFVKSTEFAGMALNSNNYYVIATRNPLFNLPYSVNEIYGIKNNSGNRYQGTKRIYSTFYPLCQEYKTIRHPELVIVEDSNSGYDFFSNVCNKYNIECISANGNSNIYRLIKENTTKSILIIADGAAFGAEIGRILSLNSYVKNIGIYLPESFEWIILNSGILSSNKIKDILNTPSKYIESSQYFTWERFFTDLLKRETAETPHLKYTKEHLNHTYLHAININKIIEVMPKNIINKDNL